MAKLYFNYAAMNAGKSAILLQASHNYKERGMRTLLLTPALDTRSGRAGRISSRIGLQADAHTFEGGADLEALIAGEHSKAEIACVFVDEAQFLTEDQVWQLARMADDHGVPVMCFGLRTDFRGALFPGSAALLAIADSLRELRTICWCGRKATMTLRLGDGGAPVEEGAQIEIGGDEKYVSLCRRHWRERKIKAGRASTSGRGSPSRRGVRS